jgi:acyl carrier protein
LNACLNVFYFSLPEEVKDTHSDDIYLPVMIDSIRFYSKPDNIIWSHAHIRQGSGLGNDKVKIDIDLFSETGRLVVECEGLSLKRVNREGLFGVLQTSHIKQTHKLQQTEKLAERSGLLKQLKVAPQNRLKDIMLAYVRDQVVEVLGLDSSYPIKLQQGLFEIGINSLSAVELMKRFETSLECTLSPTMIFNYPTIEALSGYLTREVVSMEPEEGDMRKDDETRKTIDLAKLEQLSEDEAEALLMKKLDTIRSNLK